MNTLPLLATELTDIPPSSRRTSPFWPSDMRDPLPWRECVWLPPPMDHWLGWMGPMLLAAAWGSFYSMGKLRFPCCRSRFIHFIPLHMTRCLEESRNSPVVGMAKPSRRQENSLRVITKTLIH